MGGRSGKITKQEARRPTLGKGYMNKEQEKESGFSEMPKLTCLD